MVSFLQHGEDEIRRVGMHSYILLVVVSEAVVSHNLLI